MGLKDQNQEAIIEALNSVPSALEVDDVADLFDLVKTYYVLQTPRCINVRLPSNLTLPVKNQTNHALNSIQNY